MRRGVLPAAAALLIGLAALPALSGSLRATSSSSTKAFSIDGKRFVADGSAGDDISAIRRELQKQGLDIHLDAPAPPVPAFPPAGSLREDGDARGIPPLPLPHGLSADHVMRMETASGPVDVAFGTSHIPSQVALDRLRASGWACVPKPPGQDSIFVASRSQGRETSIVLLEERQREFLVLRQVEKQGR